MNDSCCYSLQISQQICESGISRTQTNTYTNLTPNTTIELEFGYTLTFISGTSTYATIRLENDILLSPTNFNIPNCSQNTRLTRVFNLPCQCGTYILSICAILVTCPTENYCCNIDID